MGVKLAERGKQKALLPTAHTRINQALQHSRRSDGVSRTLYHFIFFKMSRPTLNSYGYYAKQYGGPSKLKSEPPCDLMGIYLSEGKSLCGRDNLLPLPVRYSTIYNKDMEAI